jgi:hypothetical protein
MDSAMEAILPPHFQTSYWCLFVPPRLIFLFIFSLLGCPHAFPSLVLRLTIAFQELSSMLAVPVAIDDCSSIQPHNYAMLQFCWDPWRRPVPWVPAFARLLDQEKRTLWYPSLEQGELNSAPHQTVEERQHEHCSVISAVWKEHVLLVNFQLIL